MNFITISYNGEEFPNLEDAITKATIDGISENIASGLEPFKNEIENSGGKVILDFKGDLSTNLKCDVIFQDMPSELSDKIKLALDQ